MNRLPLTVISGYLGAGKTTLVNRLLAGSHGRRLMVMVNDFGAVNIDQSLIEMQDDDVIALTNGCICCTMGSDLFLALSAALDRRPRPDHLIVEASGIADPKSIANTAIAEPELRYAGIITLVDALNIKDLLGDPLVGPQVRQQIEAADLLIQTKKPQRDPELDHYLRSNGLQSPDIINFSGVEELALDPPEDGNEIPPSAHVPYQSWHDPDPPAVDYARLQEALSSRPAALYRVKGFVQTDRGLQEIQAVGKHLSLRPARQDTPPVLVGLGLSDRITSDDIAAWWRSVVNPVSAAKDRVLTPDSR